MVSLNLQFSPSACLLKTILVSLSSSLPVLLLPGPWILSAWGSRGRSWTSLVVARSPVLLIWFLRSRLLAGWFELLLVLLGSWKLRRLRVVSRVSLATWGRLRPGRSCGWRCRVSLPGQGSRSAAWLWWWACLGYLSTSGPVSEVRTWSLWWWLRPLSVRRLLQASRATLSSRP